MERRKKQLMSLTCNRLCVFATLIQIVLLCSNASPRENDKKALEAIHGCVEVVVSETIAPNQAVENAMTELIKTDVELRLRTAGVKVYDFLKSGGGCGLLCVDIYSYEESYTTGKHTGDRMFVVLVELVLNVCPLWKVDKLCEILDRSDSMNNWALSSAIDSVVLHAEIWDSMSFGSCETSSFGPTMREEVKNHIDSFINDFLAAKAQDEGK
jgi:hypothetical protein